MSPEPATGAIQTVSGRWVDPLDPALDQIEIGDIAQSLSNQCRFGGHCRVFYSVAQHSTIVADLMLGEGAGEEAALAALLHDATEAYLVDLPHPIKHRSELGVPFRRAEAILAAAIGERFGLVDPGPRLKQLDRSLLATEREAFTSTLGSWPELEGFEPLGLTIEPWDPPRARRQFLDRFERLRPTAP